MSRLLSYLLVAYLFSGCHAGRTVIFNFGNYDDYKKFDQLPIEAGNSTELPIQNISTSLLDPLDFPEFHSNGSFEKFLEDQKTTAFLVLRRDTVVYERYFNGYEPDQLHCVNSVSKSFISLLMGLAVESGAIASLDDPLASYLPEFEDT